MRRKALKKHLDQLGDLVVENEFEVQQSRYYFFLVSF